MAKSFVCRRTPQAEAMIEDTTEYLHDHLRGMEKQYGQNSPEAWETRVALAALRSVAEHHENVASLLARHVTALKDNQEANPMWIFWALSLLFEAYANLNRIPEAMLISKEGRAIAKKTNASKKDPFLEVLVQQATALESKGDPKIRQRGFVVALLTLSWYVSHGFERSCADAHVKDQLRSLFAAYRIRGDEWEWTVKHAHLTRYDFVGLLSILLHHTGLAPRPLSVVAKRGSARTTRRAAQP